MPALPAPGFVADLILAQASPLASLAAVAGLGAAGVLGWLLWRTRRDYSMQLTEQSQQVAEEQAKARQAAAESQAKAEMLATLSREIRAHLNGVIGSADLLLDNTLNPPQRELVTTLRSSADALNRSVNDVLEFSNIEAGRVDLAQMPFDLREPLIDVVESLTQQALLKGLELVLIVAADAPVQVTGDAARLRQVLHNLLSNAVKFTPTGRVVLRVELPKGSASPSTPGDGWVHFSVSDTGPAIPGELLPTIFDRFGQSDSPSPRKFGGSGLELAISKKLVELMGGRIGARTLPDTGMEFWAVLPLPEEKTTAPAKIEPLDGIHVVVLDDVAASRVAASAMLTRLGVDHDVTDTETKAAGLLRDAADGGAHELVLLLDDSVARERGTEIGRILTEAPLQSTRVVLMSPQAEVSPATQPFPVAGVARKPLLRASALLAVLRKAPVPAPVTSRPFEPAADRARGSPLVLVVDDDEISRSVSSQLLARLGCVVEVAASGAEGVARARNSRYDLIFMDCQMPEMDGFATTEKIRALTGRQAPPIVALTANISTEDRERCFAVGMCDFVAKPARKAELERVVRTWIRPELLVGK